MMNTRLAYFAFPIYLLFAISCAHADKKDCKHLRQGDFYYKGNEISGGSSIHRHDSIQIVTDEKTGEELKEKLVWVDPCTYVLYPFPGTRADIVNSDLFPIKVSILEVASHYYIAHVISWNHKSDFRDTAWIIGPQ
jgi:hypothetical protein